MKKIIFYKIVILMSIFFLSTSMINNGINKKLIKKDTYHILLYDNVWGSIYHAEERQCDSTPTITGDGSIINPKLASNYRWIAISQDLINDMYRAELSKKYKYDTNRFNGKIQYGDTIWIVSPHIEINGWWVVHDAKNKRYIKSIDFLQTKGDNSLFKDDSKWSGKFENIKIYSKILVM